MERLTRVFALDLSCAVVDCRVYLERREPQSALYGDFATYGFLPRLTDGRLIVSALWRGGSGENAGLRLGDELVEIDGQDTTASSFEMVCKLLDQVGQFGANDAPISVTRLRDGTRETVRIVRAPLVTNAVSTGNN